MKLKNTRGEAVEIIAMAYAHCNPGRLDKENPFFHIDVEFVARRGEELELIFESDFPLNTFAPNTRLENLRLRAQGDYENGDELYAWKAKYSGSWTPTIDYQMAERMFRTLGRVRRKALNDRSESFGEYVFKILKMYKIKTIVVQKAVAKRGLALSEFSRDMELNAEGGRNAIDHILRKAAYDRAKQYVLDIE